MGNLIQNLRTALRESARRGGCPRRVLNYQITNLPNSPFFHFLIHSAKLPWDPLLPPAAPERNKPAPPQRPRSARSPQTSLDHAARLRRARWAAGLSAP